VILGLFSGAFSLIPFSLKHSGNLRICSNLYLISLTAGFTGLSLIEGGMNGHTVAWLSVIPLCAMILASKKDAVIWSGTSILLISLFGFWHLKGYRFPETFPDQHKPLVGAVGYGALIPFLVLLGAIFESTRRRAFSQLESAMELLTSANNSLVKLDREKMNFSISLPTILRIPCQ